MRRLRLAFRRRPRASSARFPFATRRSGGLLQSGDPQWQGWTRPQPSRCLAPRQSGSSPGCCQVVREVSEDSRRPSAVSGAPPSLRNQRHGVPCLARCISPPAAIRSRRGTSVAVFRDRAGLPRQTPDCSSAPGFPDYRVAPANAVSLRRRRIASMRPGCPGLPGGPGEAVIGRRQHGNYCTPVISASPPPRV